MKLRQICTSYGGIYDEKREICKLTSEQYKKFRQDFNIDFTIERDGQGVSFVSKKDNRYFIENWLKPKRPIYSIAGLVERERPYWELIIFKPINKLERNKIKREINELSCVRENWKS